MHTLKCWVVTQKVWWTVTRAMGWWRVCENLRMWRWHLQLKLRARGHKQFRSSDTNFNFVWLKESIWVLLVYQKMAATCLVAFIPFLYFYLWISDLLGDTHLSLLSRITSLSSRSQWDAAISTCELIRSSALDISIRGHFLHCNCIPNGPGYSYDAG